MNMKAALLSMFVRPESLEIIFLSMCTHLHRFCTRRNRVFLTQPPLRTAGRLSAVGHAEAQVVSKTDLTKAARAFFLLPNLVGYVLRVSLDHLR